VFLTSSQEVVLRSMFFNGAGYSSTSLPSVFSGTSSLASVFSSSSGQSRFSVPSIQSMFPSICCCTDEPQHCTVVDTMISPEGEDTQWVEDDNLFMAVLNKKYAKEPLGLNADFMDEKVMHVSKVAPMGDSAVVRYNATAGVRQIRKGDYILAVNNVCAEFVPVGQKVSEALRKALLEEECVVILVSRPVVFEVRFSWKGHKLESPRGVSSLLSAKKEGPNLGLDITYSKHGVSLIIINVNDGAVKTHCGSRVQAGDRIVSVNGMVGNPQTLLQALARDPDSVRMKLSRPRPTPWQPSKEVRFADEAAPVDTDAGPTLLRAITRRKTRQATLAAIKEKGPEGENLES